MSPFVTKCQHETFWKLAQPLKAFVTMNNQLQIYTIRIIMLSYSTVYKNVTTDSHIKLLAVNMLII